VGLRVGYGHGHQARTEGEGEMRSTTPNRGRRRGSVGLRSHHHQIQRGETHERIPSDREDAQAVQVYHPEMIMRTGGNLDGGEAGVGLQTPVQITSNGLEDAAVPLPCQDDDSPLIPPAVVGKAATGHALPTVVITNRSNNSMPPHPHHHNGLKLLFPPNKLPFLVTPPSKNLTPHPQARGKSPTTHPRDSSPPKQIPLPTALPPSS